MSSTIVTLNPQASPAEEEKEEPLSKRFPIVKGWKILLALPEIEETFNGSIVKADTTKRFEESSSVVGFVLDMGDMAYKDETKFPTGPWCAKGDFVLIGAFKGTRFRIEGKEFRLINDDTVEAVVMDPRGYTRA